MKKVVSSGAEEIEGMQSDMEILERMELDAQFDMADAQKCRLKMLRNRNKLWILLKYGV